MPIKKPNYPESPTRVKTAAADAGQTSKKSGSNATPQVVLCPLSQLLLDATNPRLGKQCQPEEKQPQVLDTIVDVFGVDDVLSSIAVNGYFDAEPLVGIHEGNKIRIKEGNRRLVACLILAGDPLCQKPVKTYIRVQGATGEIWKAADHGSSGWCMTIKLICYHISASAILQPHSLGILLQKRHGWLRYLKQAS